MGEMPSIMRLKILEDNVYIKESKAGFFLEKSIDKSFFRKIILYCTLGLKICEFLVPIQSLKVSFFQDFY